MVKRRKTNGKDRKWRTEEDYEREEGEEGGGDELSERGTKGQGKKRGRKRKSGKKKENE